MVLKPKAKGGILIDKLVLHFYQNTCGVCVPFEEEYVKGIARDLN